MFAQPCERDQWVVFVRLATSVVVRTGKIKVDLRVEFADVDSVKSLTALNMDGRFERSLGMPWVDWRTKSIGSSSAGRTEVQACHEPSFAHQLVNSISDGTSLYLVGVGSTTGSSENAPLTPSVESAPLVASLSHEVCATISDATLGGSVEAPPFPRRGPKSTLGQRRRCLELRVCFASPLVNNSASASNVIDTVAGAYVHMSTID
jgi:hypothetical protein